MSDFSSTFKYLRKRAGLTQEELSEKLRMSKSSISMYENGNREPEFETLEVIADYFNVDMNFLLGIEKKPGESKWDDVQALENAKLFSGLTEEKKREALRYLRYLSGLKENG